MVNFKIYVLILAVHLVSKPVNPITVKKLNDSSPKKFLKSISDFMRNKLQASKLEHHFYKMV